MKVLVSFATSEGHTRRIATYVADVAKARGHDVELYDTASLESTSDVGAFDAILLAASVHESSHQHSARDFAIAHGGQLARVPSAFISVSLSAATDDGLEEAQGYVDRFIADTQWTPKKTLLVGGALRLGDYDYFQRQVMANILRRRGLPQQADGDYEFTDWAALQKFVVDLLDVRGARAA
jgi:menaquinone-dependent protoporphyrinogen oxidase